MVRVNPLSSYQFRVDPSTGASLLPDQDGDSYTEGFFICRGKSMEVSAWAAEASQTINANLVHPSLLPPYDPATSSS